MGPPVLDWGLDTSPAKTHPKDGRFHHSDEEKLGPRSEDPQPGHADIDSPARAISPQSSLSSIALDVDAPSEYSKQPQPMTATGEPVSSDAEESLGASSPNPTSPVCSTDNASAPDAHATSSSPTAAPTQPLYAWSWTMFPTATTPTSPSAPSKPTPFFSPLLTAASLTSVWGSVSSPTTVASLPVASPVAAPASPIHRSTPEPLRSSSTPLHHHHHHRRVASASSYLATLRDAAQTQTRRWVWEQRRLQARIERWEREERERGLNSWDMAVAMAADGDEPKGENGAEEVARIGVAGIDGEEIVLEVGTENHKDSQQVDGQESSPPLTTLVTADVAAENETSKRPDNRDSEGETTKPLAILTRPNNSADEQPQQKQPIFHPFAELLYTMSPRPTSPATALPPHLRPVRSSSAVAKAGVEPPASPSASSVFQSLFSRLVPPAPSPTLSVSTPVDDAPALDSSSAPSSAESTQSDTDPSAPPPPVERRSSLVARSVPTPSLSPSASAVHGKAASRLARAPPSPPPSPLMAHLAAPNPAHCFVIIPGEGLVSAAAASASSTSLVSPSNTCASPTAGRIAELTPEEDRLWRLHPIEVRRFVERTRTKLHVAVQFLAAKGFDVSRAIHLFEECRRAAQDPLQLRLSISQPAWRILSNPVLCLPPGARDRAGRRVVLLNLRFWEDDEQGLVRMHWALRFLAEKLMDEEREAARTRGSDAPGVGNEVAIVGNAEGAPEGLPLSEVLSTVMDLVLYTTPLKLLKLVIVNAPWYWPYLSPAAAPFIPTPNASPAPALLEPPPSPEPLQRRSSLLALTNGAGAAPAAEEDSSVSDEDVLRLSVVDRRDEESADEEIDDGFVPMESDEVPVHVCRTFEELERHVDSSMVVEELGGTMKYEHEVWVRDTLKALEAESRPTVQSPTRPPIPARTASLNPTVGSPVRVSFRSEAEVRVAPSPTVSPTSNAPAPPAELMWKREVAGETLVPGGVVPVAPGKGLSENVVAAVAAGDVPQRAMALSVVTSVPTNPTTVLRVQPSSSIQPTAALRWPSSPAADPASPAAEAAAPRSLKRRKGTEPHRRASVPSAFPSVVETAGAKQEVARRATVSAAAGGDLRVATSLPSLAAVVPAAAAVEVAVAQPKSRRAAAAAVVQDVQGVRIAGGKEDGMRGTAKKTVTFSPSKEVISYEMEEEVYGDDGGGDASPVDSVIGFASAVAMGV
ncbi:hypothetical protein HDU96_005527 [Phlyctochytrium bullatum]|nr:hypothetical protein HDU96_005527 [Phlyctochytrium bullatum]